MFVSSHVVFGFETTSYTVVEGTDSAVRLTLFRDGAIDIPAVVDISTVTGTATGGEMKHTNTYNSSR